MAEDALTIGEVAEKFGITHRTIRFYEERGLVKVRRSDGGTRFFDPAAVARIAEILELKEQGLTLTEILDLIQKSRGRPLKLPRKQVETQLQFLLDQRATLNEQIAFLKRKLKEFLN